MQRHNRCIGSGSTWCDAAAGAAAGTKRLSSGAEWASDSAPLMPLLRSILSALLLLSCLSGASQCLLAGAMEREEAGKTEMPCCPAERTAPGVPAPAEGCCMKCVTLESGVNLDSLRVLSVAMPVFVVDEAFSKVLEELNRQAVAAPVGEVEASPPRLLPVWQLVARTALPVRGPSLLA
jgi:hypothetical protein